MICWMRRGGILTSRIFSLQLGRCRSFLRKKMILRTRIFSWDMRTPGCRKTKRRAVLSSEPESQPALVGLAQTLEMEKNPEAADAYRNYLKAQPGDAAAREHLVRLLIANEKYDEALAEMEKTEKGGAPSVESLKLRADILIGEKKWDAAIATLKQAVALAPNDAQLRGGLVRTYIQQLDFLEFEKKLESAIRLDAKNVTYW